MNARENLLSALGKALKSLRSERELTLAALAERAGLSARFLAQVEAGQGNISVSRLVDLAHALGTTAAELLAGAEEMPDRHRTVALLGLRGAGKSTVGPRLAERLNAEFVELDQLIEHEAGMSLGEVFELQGSGFFRKLEQQVLEGLLARTPRAVIATGGSIVTDTHAYDLLRRSTTTVWLKARPEDHMERVRAQGDERPMRSRNDAMAELRALLKARAPLYAMADHVVDTSLLGVDGSVNALVGALTN
ncbi:MAG: shikimate kinase [Polyangiaceae bacterium]